MDQAESEKRQAYRLLEEAALLFGHGQDAHDFQAYSEAERLRAEATEKVNQACSVCPGIYDAFPKLAPFRFSHWISDIEFFSPELEDVRARLGI